MKLKLLAAQPFEIIEIWKCNETEHRMKRASLEEDACRRAMRFQFDFLDNSPCHVTLIPRSRVIRTIERKQRRRRVGVEIAGRFKIVIETSEVEQFAWYFLRGISEDSWKLRSRMKTVGGLEKILTSRFKMSLKRRDISYVCG